MRAAGDNRPDPDVLLRAVQKKGEGSSRGRLKVFFGMAAGSGKTYAMLTAAHRAIADGVDVAAAFIESHRRSDIERLSEGIPVIPRRRSVYRGVPIEELDIDAVLEKHPGIALVDELAHTNTPDSRHPKRYQDVIELLDAGIDVYTTLNVQHLESRAGTVREITGVTVQETLPDSVLELADEIVLIDISPETLLKRLSEGRIYPPERARLAAENFFNTGNLTALREMALRFTADNVDHSLQEYRQTNRIIEPWKTGDRLLVAVSQSPFSESLIRWTRRMAYGLGASWIAVYVETSKKLSRSDQETLQKNISLARELGAEVVVTRDEDVTGGILRVARQRNITQIVAGKPGSGSWRDVFRFRTPIKRLIRESGNIDLYIIRSGDELSHGRKASAALPREKAGWAHYVYAMCILIAVILINYAVLPYIGARSVALILLLSVLTLALFLDRIPVFIYAGMSAILWNFFFLTPRFTLFITHIEDLIMFFMYFIIAVIVGSLTARLRTQQKSTLYREEQLNVLYDMTKTFTSSRIIDEAVAHVMSYVSREYNAAAVLYIRDDTGSLSASPHALSTAVPDDREYAVASYSFNNGKTAGRFSDTLPSSSTMFIPLYITRENRVGVLGIRFPDDMILAMEQKTLLETLASHLALVIERDFYMMATQKVRIHEESEKLYRVLMNSLTHEIRTPLAAIKGSISTMMDPMVNRNEEVKGRLLSETQEATDRLIRLVDSLLDMSRIESGRLLLNPDWNDIADIIATVLGRLEDRFDVRAVRVSCPEDIPLVRVDYSLMVQAIHCLVHNALVHTKPGTRIELSVSRLEEGIGVAVEDEGPGLPPGDAGRLFEKFFRSDTGHHYGGLGLGLSICKGIVELHGGSIMAENRPGGGARFAMSLPVGTREKKE
jgi:two-component system, OmpR family, sensor histidine kinase KdpD